MPIVFAALIIIFALVVALVVIGREADTHEVRQMAVGFDIDDAVAWIGDQLPEEQQGQLSYEDVRRIVEWNIEYMKARGVIANGHTPTVTGPVVIGGAETAAFVLRRADEAGMELTPEQVHLVLEAQVAYLQHVGAVGDPADDE